MSSLSKQELMVQHGNVIMFDHFLKETEFWTGAGDRSSVRIVRFDEAFNDAPRIQISLALLDADRTCNLRYSLTAEAVLPDAFSVRFMTWSDTRVARVGVNWIAIGFRSPLVEVLNNQEPAVKKAR